MSTRGCFGFRVGRHQHMVTTWHDSYPESLGKYLARQIAHANLEIWAKLARQLRSTSHEASLTETETRYITDWLASRIHGSLHYDEEDARPTPGYLSVKSLFPDVRIEGPELAGLIKPGLAKEPRRFWEWFWGDCETILNLGLYPSAEGWFTSSPFCEWFYLINFNTQEFVVGTGDYDLDEFLERPIDKKVEGCVRTIAAFPLQAIPEDWISIVHDLREKIA